MRPQSSTSRQQFVRLCECGCGQPTLIARQHAVAKGWERGQPLRFINGHHHAINRERFRNGRYQGRKRHGEYIVCHVPDHPYADKRGYVPEHRLAMEEELGRYLTPDEVVHHRNRKKDDNRPENLQVMTHPEHMRLHHAEDRRWSLKYPACRECGTTEIKHFGRGYCDRCYHRLYARARSSRGRA